VVVVDCVVDVDGVVDVLDSVVEVLDGVVDGVVGVVMMAEEPDEPEEVVVCVSLCHQYHSLTRAGVHQSI